jgi:hypothetical protein
MAHPPVLLPSVLAPRWWQWAARRRRSILALGAVAVGAGAAIAFSSGGAPIPPAIVPVAAIAPVRPVATVTEPAPPAADERSIDMAPVITDGELRVVLRGDVEDDWLTGKPTVTEDDGVTVVTRALSKTGRAQVKEAIGTRVRLYSADGASCLARVTGAVALGRFEGVGELEPGAGPQGAWDAASATVVVAGDLEPLEGSCDQALWARTESLPAPSLAEAGKPADKIRRAAAAALRARPEYAEITGGDGGKEEIRVTSWSAGGETLVVATLLLEGCVEDAWPVLTALWRLDHGALRFVGAEESITEVLAAADVDGDGSLELVGRDDLIGVAVLRRGDGRFEVAERAPVAVLGCRC